MHSSCDYLVGTDDTVWGIGLPESHPDATWPEYRPGTNLLGLALMRARQALRNV